MSETLAGLVVAAVVIAVGLVTLHLMFTTWDGQNSDVRAVLGIYDDRLNTSMCPASPTSGDLDCDSFTGTVTNAGNTSVADFSQMDVMVDYTDPTDAKVNGDGITYYWSAFKAQDGLMTTGSYTGNGSSQSLTGLGYSPEVVIVLPAEADEANIKTFDMPGALAMQLDDEDGFSVAQSSQVNKSGKKYHYLAWNAVVGKIAQGSYPGNGAGNRSLEGIGFQPELVMIKAHADIEGVNHPDVLGSATDETLSNRALANFSDGIQALESDGFQVGASTTVNGSGTACYWVAFTSG